MSKISNIFNGRRWLRNLLIAVLILVTVGGIVGGVVALTRNTDKIDDALTYKSIGWTKYGIGGLDSNGNYKSTDQSIYTKKAFECQGLNVTPEFDKDVSYEIFFYDQNNKFVHTTGRLTGAFVQDSVPFFAKYARIVITPNDDNKVTIFEKRGYAKQLNVTVYREQGFKNYTDNLLEIEYTDKHFVNGVLTNEDGMSASKKIYLTSYSEGLCIRSMDTSKYAWITFFDENDQKVGSLMILPQDAVQSMDCIGGHYWLFKFDGQYSSAKYIRVCAETAYLDTLGVYFR